MPGKAREASSGEAAKQESPEFQVANTRNIIEKNLFDPERGANRTQEAEASAAAMQRIRSMTLVGTVILGNSRYAIMQEPSAGGAPAAKTPAAGSGQTRLKLGDTIEGFRLSEIRDKSVLFTKGGSRVEVGIDFFKPVESAPAARPPIPPRPALVPRVGPRVPPTVEAGQTSTNQDNPSSVERARKALRERQPQPAQQPPGRPQRVAPSNPESAPAASP